MSYDKAPVEREWDADAADGRLRAWAGGPEKENMDWAKYREGFAWYDAENAEGFGAYKLPHHDIVDGRLSVVWRGVAAAGAVIQGGRGGADIPSADVDAVKAHLARHYEEFERTAPWEQRASEAEAVQESEKPLDKPQEKEVEEKMPESIIEGKASAGKAIVAAEEVATMESDPRRQLRESVVKKLKAGSLKEQWTAPVGLTPAPASRLRNFIIVSEMIPVADWFGKGVDAVQAWVTEVGKMPEVKGFVDAASGAFEGFWKGLQEVGKFIQDTFGPVLQELWGAFKELWDALSPIGEALSEIFGIFGEGTEGVDLLKAAVMAIAFEIKGFAEIIKAIAPYIREFAEAFKAAVDFIAPVLGQLKDVIGGFIDWLKNAFQGFYDWLVGGSLWKDTWNQVLSIAGSMITALLGDLGSKLFEPMKAAFTRAVESVRDLWDKGWQAVHTTFTTISDQIATEVTDFLDLAKRKVTEGIDNIKTNWETGWKAVETTFNTVTDQVQSDLNTKFEAMKSFVQTNLGEYAPIANNALNAMQSAMNAVMALIRGDWQGFLANMKMALDSWWAAAQAATVAGFSILQSSFSSSMGAIQGILNGAITAMQSAWGGFSSWLGSSISAAQSAISSAASSVSSTLGSMQSAASSAGQQISNAVTGAFDAVGQAASDLWKWMTGGSVWTDMLAEMQSQTEAALGNIVGDFQGAFDNVAMSVPVGARAETAAPATTAPILAGPQSITVPVTVTLDGVVIARTVKKILLEQRQYSERSIGRLT